MTDKLPIARPMLRGFLSDHSSREDVVSIKIEPGNVYVEDTRDSQDLSFDFLIQGLSDRILEIRFIKVAVYDIDGHLLTFRHLNHNAIGTPSIHTIGKFTIEGQETIDVFNPFFRYSKNIPIGHLRYMFTFRESATGSEYYYGNILVKPVIYRQRVKLTLPLKGLLTVLDGHDFYSHHRRFAMSIVRNYTGGRFASNFNRFASDFTVLGPNGNTRIHTPGTGESNYDFHFDDVSKFHTHGAIVYAPGDGEIVDVVDNLEDLYEEPFDMDSAIGRNAVEEIAGNYIIIKHNDEEFSHLFHLMKNSIDVDIDDYVECGQPIAKVGFSGASTTYSHLHFQLMDGKNFLLDNPLPCKFSNVTLIVGSKHELVKEHVIDTGDFLLG